MAIHVDFPPQGARKKRGPEVEPHDRRGKTATARRWGNGWRA